MLTLNVFCVLCRLWADGGSASRVGGWFKIMSLP